MSGPNAKRLSSDYWELVVTAGVSRPATKQPGETEEEAARAHRERWERANRAVFTSIVEAAAKVVAELRGKGADWLVPLSHAKWNADELQLRVEEERWPQGRPLETQPVKRRGKPGKLTLHLRGPGLLDASADLSVAFRQTPSAGQRDQIRDEFSKALVPMLSQVRD